MNISPEDIIKGENIFSSFTSETKCHFLADIYAERTADGYYKSLEYLYGSFPDYRKVVVVNFALIGEENDKLTVARHLSNSYNHERIWVDFFDLTYQWLTESNNEKIIEYLSRGLLFYIDRNETVNYISRNLNSNLPFVKGVISWLNIQPDWFREKHKKYEIEIWTQLNSSWPNTTFDEYQSREINKALGLDVNPNELWFHEIQNPWNFNDSKIIELSKLGVNIKMDDYLGEFAMGSPLITELVVNDKKLPKAIGGPFIVDDDYQFLCCTTFEREGGFKLVAIDLVTNNITELHSNLSIYCPYKFENNNFLVITKQQGKIDLTRDLLKFPLPERKTTHNSTLPKAGVKWWQNLFRN